MTRRGISAGALVGSLLSGACVGSASPPRFAPRPTAQAWPEADALFHKDPLWLGADVASSVDLGGGRVLWLFGDTFVASSAGGGRSQATMVRNSVAIQTGYDPSRASIAFRWGSAAGAPASLFAGPGSDWYWPGHGAMVDGRLVVFLSRITARTGGLGFEAAGWAVVRIDDPAGDPSTWKPVPLATPASTLGVTFGEAVLVRAGFLYAYGADDASHAVHLLRYPVDAVAKGDLSAPEWWTPSGWAPLASLHAPPAPLFADGATEMSVQPAPTGGGWFAVQTTGFGAATLDLRRGGDLTGPWGELATVFTPPESRRPGVLVYAGKGHPEQQGAPLVATYTSNAGDVATLLRDPSLYYPRFVRVSWEVQP